MKQTIFALLMLLSMAALGFAQLQTSAPAGAEGFKNDEVSIKARFANTDGLIDVTNPANRNLAARQAASNIRARDVRPGPGDYPVFILKSSHEFIRRGETLELSLIPILTSNRGMNINIMSLDPGNDGEYDGTQPPRYFPADNGNYGHVDGIQVFREIKLCSRLFTAADTLGRHIYSIASYDDNGHLIQQILVDVYLVNAGHYGRYFYISTVQPVPTALNLTGNFPSGLPIYYYVGTPEAGEVIIGPDPQYAPRSNGTELTLPVGMNFNRTTSIDIMLWSPIMRYAMVKPHALAEDVPPQ